MKPRHLEMLLSVVEELNQNDYRAFFDNEIKQEIESQCESEEELVEITKVINGKNYILRGNFRLNKALIKKEGEIK